MNRYSAILLQIVAALILFMCHAHVARAANRLAFVAGVNDYANLGPGNQLQRAVIDAHTVAETLQSIGFRVTELTNNVTLTGFLDAFGRFTRTIEPGDTVVFYFAGHGISIENTNYLLPGDIPSLSIGGESTVKKLALAEPDIITEIQKNGARVSILIIDACRDNPFPKTANRSVGAARGLTAKEPPQGVFALYAAGAGQRALDSLPGLDSSPNSVFTRIFSAEIRKPGVSLLDLGETVREEVADLARRANHDQVPAVYNQILGARRIHLAATSVTAPSPIERLGIAALPTTQPTSAGAAIPTSVQEANDFSNAASSYQVSSLRIFMHKYPNSKYDFGQLLTSFEQLERSNIMLGYTKPYNPAEPSKTIYERECDERASSPDDLSKPPRLKGVVLTAIDHEKAISACQEAIALAPNVGRFYFQLGRALEARKPIDNAIEQYILAAHLRSVAAMRRLAAYYNERGRRADTRYYYKMAAAEGDGDAKALLSKLNGELSLGVEQRRQR